MRTIEKQCLNCFKTFSIPRCRDWREKCCSSACKKEYREKNKIEERERRKRTCHGCGSVFYPRNYQIKSGDGKYCSFKCAHAVLVAKAHSDKANQKRSEARRLAIENGSYVYAKGENHVQWKGGKIAARQRRTKNGKANSAIRKYRLANPHKTREWMQNRRRRKFGRLPRGYIKSLFDKQRGMCAICRIKFGNGYHVDHINPISRGGLHEAGNIQLLCGTCNVRKSAKDPIAFMQELGFLL